MNFKFPSSMDNNNIPPHSDFNRNPNFSYLTQHSIRARFTSAEVRHQQFEFARNPMDIRGSYHRELEKEQIRAELIAEDIMRRRILEEEVRREMMMERELALRRGVEGYGIGIGMGMGRSSRIDTAPRVPLLTNFEHREGLETMPFQRDPGVIGKGYVGDTVREIKEVNGVLASSEGSSKDKVIIMAKPSANLADIKRKAMTPPVGGSIEVLKKQKSKEDWSCALCRITATSERGLNEHLQGKKHKIRERGMVTQRTGFGIGPSPKMNDTDRDGPFSLPNIVRDNATVVKSVETLADDREIEIVKEPTNKRKKKFRFLCEICQTGAFSLKVFNAHKRGKKHLRKLSELNDIDKASLVVSSAQKGALEENEEAEIVALENNVDLVTAGEQVDNNGVDAKINVDLVEDKVFLKTVSVQKAVMEENMEVEVAAETVVMEPVLEIVGVETMAPNTTNMEPSCDGIDDMQTVPEPISGETVSLKTNDQESVPDVIDVMQTVSEPISGETVASKTTEQESVCDGVDDMQKVPEPVSDEIVAPKITVLEPDSGETVAPKTTDQKSVCNGNDGVQKVPEPTISETMARKTTDQESVSDDMQKVPEPVSGESVTPKTLDEKFVCDKVDC